MPPTDVKWTEVKWSLESIKRKAIKTESDLIATEINYNSTSSVLIKKHIQEFKIWQFLDKLQLRNQHNPEVSWVQGMD